MVPPGRHPRRLIKWDNATSFNSEYTLQQMPFYLESLVWLRISDDTTDLTYSWSTDGRVFEPVYVGANTDFLTADEIGFMIFIEGAAGNGRVRLLSWEEA